MAKPKTKKAKSCASKRAYAKGKKKGKCVPKASLKAKTKRSTRACYAKTRDDAIKNLDLYDKRKESAAVARAKKLEKKAYEAGAAQRADEGADWTASEFSGLHGRRSRRRHRRSRR